MLVHENLLTDAVFMKCDFVTMCHIGRVCSCWHQLVTPPPELLWQHHTGQLQQSIEHLIPDLGPIPRLWSGLCRISRDVERVGGELEAGIKRVGEQVTGGCCYLDDDAVARLLRFSARTVARLVSIMQLLPTGHVPGGLQGAVARCAHGLGRADLLWAGGDRSGHRLGAPGL